MDWCPKCRYEVLANTVTIDGIHEGCGYAVLDYDPTAEATRLRAVVEEAELAIRENARLTDDEVAASCFRLLADVLCRKAGLPEEG